MALATRFLHTVARVALRVGSPRRAKAWVGTVGLLFPSFSGKEEARAEALELRAAGTCLSRAIAIAARLPDAKVVIGVDPSVETALPLFAHAWVEIGGIPLVPSDAQGHEIARL
jgi:hypothetical protein